MEEVLVPLYLHHRYQIDAAASAVGGIHYIYAMRGDDRQPVKPVPARAQTTALDALIAALDPSELALPSSVLRNLPPRPSGYGPHRELFPRNTGSAFDAITPAVVLADLIAGNLLAPDRAARLIEQRAIDPSLPGLGDVIDRLFRATVRPAGKSEYEAEIARAVQHVIVDNVMTLAERAPMPQVRAVATLKLRQRMRDWSAPAAAGANESRVAMNAYLADEIKRFLERPSTPAARQAIPDAPPGAPIGDPAMDWIRRHAPVCSMDGSMW
jgi:hypothetical protein